MGGRGLVATSLLPEKLGQTRGGEFAKEVIIFFARSILMFNAIFCDVIISGYCILHIKDLRKYFPISWRTNNVRTLMKLRKLFDGCCTTIIV